MSVQIRLTKEERDFLLFRISMRAEWNDDGCFIWSGGVNSRGYGTISIKHQTHYVHRVMYALVHGKIDGGAYVCHHCDVVRCIAPGHLFIGTPADNYADMRSKGRARVHGKWLPPAEFEILNITEVQ